MNECSLFVYRLIYKQNRNTIEYNDRKQNKAKMS